MEKWVIFLMILTFVNCETTDNQTNDSKTRKSEKRFPLSESIQLFTTYSTFLDNQKDKDAKDMAIMVEFKNGKNLELYLWSNLYPPGIMDKKKCFVHKLKLKTRYIYFIDQKEKMLGKSVYNSLHEIIDLDCLQRANDNLPPYVPKELPGSNWKFELKGSTWVRVK